MERSLARPAPLARRALLRAWLSLPAALVLAACGAAPATTPPTSPPTNTPGTTVPPTAPTASSAGATQPPATPATTSPTAAPTVPATSAATAATKPQSSPAAGGVLAPTPTCADGDEPTVAQTEGPYFKASSPERRSLRTPGLSGTPLTVSGQVLTTSCAPVVRALLEFWQCDDRGVYDNSGFTLRGHQFTDDAGQYSLETIRPGLYPGRTRHIHVKVQAPNGPTLTTQLYFPNEAANSRDGIFNPKLLLAIQESASGQQGRFTFVLRR